MNNTLQTAVIGRTNQGNYGHSLDVAYQDLSNVRLVAVAYPDPDGVREAGERTGADRIYLEYREMLEKEKLDLVNVCPRWLDCHAEMVIACAEKGVQGIFLEKPFARTLAEADAMIEACERNGVRLVVAHRRASAYEQHAKKLIDAGAIGEVQVMRGYGKTDHRAGPVDLMVLGTHIVDSMRYFAASEVSWAHGHVTQGNREITTEDIQEAEEGIGLLAGNGVAAYYAFENGVTAHFESYPGDISSRSNYSSGFEVYGTKGIISISDSPSGKLYLYPHRRWTPEKGNEWKRIILDDWGKRPDGQIRSNQERTHLSNQMIVKELITAIHENRDVIVSSSGRDARAALEMIMAVHESQRLESRVDFPLENRDNPYETWIKELGKY